MLDAALEFVNEDPLFLPAQRPVPASSRDLSQSNLVVLQQVREMMHQMARDEAARIYTSSVDPFLFQTAEKALSAAFLADSDAAKDGLLTSLYHIVKHILTEMAITGEFDEIFDPNINVGHSLPRSWALLFGAHSPLHNFSAQSQSLLCGK